MRNRWWAASGAAAAVILLAACGSSAASGTGGSGGSGSSSSAGAGSGGSSSSSSAAGIKTISANGGTVLATSGGKAIYWFAIDTPTKSNCSGTCLTYWPPLTGKPSVASGVNLPGKWGTITRSDGTIQASYDGHPLYTYAADQPGQVTGNGINISGGLWWAETPTGAKLAAANPSPSSSSGGGGGYGY